MKGQHYYAATWQSWATASTRKEAIEKVAKEAGKVTIKEQLKVFGGLYVWTTRVLAPADAEYAITNFQPVDVPMEDPQDFRIVDVKGHVVPMD